MDYYQRTRDEFIHNEMYPVDYRKDYFPKVRYEVLMILNLLKTMIVYANFCSEICGRRYIDSDQETTMCSQIRWENSRWRMTIFLVETFNDQAI